MAFWMSLVGLGLNLVGALLLAVGDSWLSRSILAYMDAVEADVSKLVAALRAGDTHPPVTGIDVYRDRGQERARRLKAIGWTVLASGFGLQLAAVYLAARPA